MIVSAGVIPVRRTPGGWRFLILRVYRNWDFPKGLVEPGEDPLATARREAAEEACLTDLAFHWGDASWATAPYSRGKKIARYYLAETSIEAIVLPVNPELGHPEHHEGRWVDADTAAGLLPERLQDVFDRARGVLGV